MRSGSWDGATTTDNVRVTVAGTVRPVKSVRIQSGMRDGDPRSDTAAWCVEATIEWADPALVTATSPHPFGTSAGDTWRGATEWLPKPGDEVVIETGDGATGQWWVQHRGVIDVTSGSIADGTAKSTTVDRVEDLEYVLTRDPLLMQMPAISDSYGARHIGLASAWMVNELIRVPGVTFAGWNYNPPTTWETLACASHLTSLWPEVGTSREAWGPSPENLPDIIADPGTQAMRFQSIHSRVRMDLSSGIDRSSVILTAQIPRHDSVFRGQWQVDVVNAIGQGFRVWATGSDEFIRWRVIGGSQTAIADSNGSGPGSGGRASRFAVHATTDALTLRLDDGREQTLSLSSSPWPAGPVSEVVIDSNSSGFGWWIVEGVKSAAGRWASLNAPQTARFRFRQDDYTRWVGARGMLQENASEWLKEQVDAELSAMWLDEDGVLQWAGRNVLDGQSVARTITSVRDVDDIQWEQQRRRLARRAVVTYLSATVDRSYLSDYSRTAWQDDTVDCGPGELDTTIASPPDHHDWIDVDTDPHHLQSYQQPWDYYVKGSTFGGTQYRRTDDGDQGWAQFLDCTMEKITHRAYLVEFAPWSTNPSTHRVRTRYPFNESALMRVGGATLALRCRAVTIWTERELRGSAGSVGRAEYVHEAGWRVQNYTPTIGGTGDADRVLERLREAVSHVDGPRPYVTGLTIEHDPRLQIGDKIRVRDTEITGADFDILIQERDIDTATATETISGRCTLIRTEWVSGVSAHTESRLEPGGPTPMTPSAEWAREEAV